MTLKSNDELAAEFEAKLEEAEESERAKGRVFYPLKLIDRASKIHSIKHPTLGTVQFGELTFRDAFEINKCESDIEKTETVAWLMMKKAYPDLPKDFLSRMPLIESASLVDLLTKQPTFLSATKTSQNGSKTTSKHKSLG
jgi:hypothetical protein